MEMPSIEAGNTLAVVGADRLAPCECGERSSDTGDEGMLRPHQEGA